MQVAMTSPVIAADGHTYERTAIQHWLQGSSISPVASDKLSHSRLVPNMLVKSALAQHAQVSCGVLAVVAHSLLMMPQSASSEGVLTAMTVGSGAC